MISELSSAARYTDRGGDHCLIWFGGLHEPFLSTDFLPLEWNILNLLDAEFDWYTKGVTGLAPSFEDAVRRIQEIVGDQKVACGGQSSGGYAALRFAHALSGDLCFAFAPQTRNFIQEGGEQLPAVTLPSVEELYLAEPPSFPVVLHLSRTEDESRGGVFWNDWKQIAEFVDLNCVTVVRHPYDVHAVSMRLAREGRFYKTIAATLQVYVGP